MSRSSLPPNFLVSAPASSQLRKLGVCTKAPEHIQSPSILHFRRENSVTPRLPTITLTRTAFANTGGGVVCQVNKRLMPYAGQEGPPENIELLSGPRRPLNARCAELPSTNPDAPIAALASKLAKPIQGKFMSTGGLVSKTTQNPELGPFTLRNHGVRPAVINARHSV
jgi:hypothetical protein